MIILHDMPMDYPAYIRLTQKSLDKDEYLDTISLLKGQVFLNSANNPIGIEVLEPGNLKYSKEAYPDVILACNAWVDTYVTVRDIGNLTIMFEDDSLIDKKVEATIMMDISSKTGELIGIELFTKVPMIPWDDSLIEIASV